METRANYLLIGLFTLIGFIGLLGFFVWLAQVQLDRQYRQFDILFDNVSGLSQAAEVRYNGLKVGQVLSLSLDTEGSGRIRVRVEVDADTPVRQDVRAQLQSLGVTGVSYVALDGGSPHAPLIWTEAGIPTVDGQRSALDTIVEDAPDILSRAKQILEDLQGFVSPQNQQEVSAILSNVSDASARLEQALSDFSSVSKSFSEGTAQITAFTSKLEPLAGNIEVTLRKLDGTLDAASTTITEARGTLEAGTAALQSADTTFKGADSFIREQVPDVIAGLNQTLDRIDAAVSAAQSDFGTLTEGLNAASESGTARLEQLKQTITVLDRTLAQANESLTAVERASTVFENLVYGDGTALVSEARDVLADAKVAFAELKRSASEDVPVIVSEVKEAVATANRVIDQVGTDVTGFTQRLDPLTATADETLTTATETLRQANLSLQKLDGAIDTAQRTLAAAETTFDRGTEILDQDAGPALADIRASADQFRKTMEDLTTDLPDIVASIRQTVDRIDATVRSASPPIQAFAVDGLPKFTRFAQEAQSVLASIDALTRRIDRDPARFFFGSAPVEYRR